MKDNKKDESVMAIDLISHYILVVYPYVGSDYMTGTENEELKFKSAKKEAKFLCQLMLEVTMPYDGGICSTAYYNHLIYWKKVLTIIDDMSIEEYQRLTAYQ